MLLQHLLSAIVSIFVYAPTPHDGLHVAIQDASQQWQPLGQMVGSDYGAWGAEKKMFSPYVTRAADSTWRVVWQVNETAPTFAAAYTKDLITWRPQDYPVMSVKGCLDPIILPASLGCDVIFRTKDGQLHKTHANTDFRHFDKDQILDEQDAYDAFAAENYREIVARKDTLTINGKTYAGQILRVSEAEREALKSFHAAQALDAERSQERMGQDAEKLLPLLPQTVKATLTVKPSEEKAISDKLIGIFFEDISYAADGGLYAELIQNRDFEYNQEDRARQWTATTAWHSASPIQIATENPLSKENPHYALLTDQSISNEGWDGIPLKKNAKYDFSLAARNIDSQKKQVKISLMQGTQVLAQTELSVNGKNWDHYFTTLIPQADADTARLVVSVEGKGKVALDMISLFPRDTYMNRRNGLRKDLAETIAALHPKFVRFPGGCMSHGQGIDNIYHWAESVGTLERRQPAYNIWHYHQTRGLGFHEFFQWCEDMGAEPLPVLAAGVPCQNSTANKEGMGGQQGGIPMEDMQSYIYEILQLIEWANGDPKTSPAAALRAACGHPAPFNLKYIGIGNEDLISTTFEDRYLMIAKAIKEKYPSITVCGTVGPFHAPSSDYIEGWDFARKHHDVTDMVDEHYYETTGWLLNHQDYYDHYDRQGPKVYLGEWSANSGKKRSDVECALAEAIYLCNIERNGDVVSMTSYAPLLSKNGHSNWNPDLIYFDNQHITVTPSYETQRLFGNYCGDRYISSTLSADSLAAHRIGASVVKDSQTGKRYLKLVNALPVETHLDIHGIQLPKELKGEGFAGRPADRSVRITPLAVSGNDIVLPPYSFFVFEI